MTVGETVANDPYDSTKTILCERSFQEFEITEPDPITTAQSTIKGITCKGDDDGAINLVVAGGTSPFTYSWSKSGDNSYSASTEDLSDLSPGHTMLLSQMPMIVRYPDHLQLKNQIP